MKQYWLAGMVAVLLSTSAVAVKVTPNISLILNGGFSLRQHSFSGLGGLPLDQESYPTDHKGFWLDHSELAFSANADDLFYGKLSWYWIPSMAIPKRNWKKRSCKPWPCPPDWPSEADDFSPISATLTANIPIAIFSSTALSPSGLSWEDIITMTASD